VVFSPNLLFITGDIAYHGLESEYDLAEQFLQELWKVTGLGKEQTFIVPGNHDVDRSSIQNDIIFKTAYEKLRNEDNTQQWLEELEGFWAHPYLRNKWGEKFSNYFNFLNKCSNISHDLGCFIKTINISGNVIDIIGANSALMSWKDGEDKERGLWIGKPQLDELEKTLSKNPALRISLVHHPNDSLHNEDVTWGRLQDLSNIIFHGHLHKPRVLINGEPEREHICLPGGSIQDKGVWSRQRYSYGEFDFQARQLDLYLRMTNNNTPYPEYIRDNQTYFKAAPNGHLKVSIPVK
jgi:predicted phosphodiesterase